MRKAGLLVSVFVFGLVACGPNDRDDMGGDDTGDPGGGGGGTGSGSGSGSDGTIVYVYAHSASTLYRVDPDTLAVQMVAPFGWGSVGSDSMTDIAIDKAGVMIGISYNRVYKIDPATAATTLLSNSLNGTFNGLSFVPASMLGQTGDDILVGTNNSDGKVMRIDPMTGSATQVGDMGGFQSSGDLVAVEGFGTVQTVVNGPFSGADKLARLAPNTFAASAIGGGTGYSQIWGVAFFKGKVYGFTNGGQFVLIDPSNGGAMMVTQTPGISWWGAGVTTLAPVLQ
ncbi:MAG TPA: hypothetical protein VMZ53_16465 [Kofleriaceae bacterium]|nr:hypothetical protein [Kofleriaceae bacterium]